MLCAVSTLKEQESQFTFRTTFSMEKSSWEPLPPRKSRKRSNDALQAGKETTQDAEQSNQHERGPTNAISDLIEENIRTRMKINHNITKLTSKDGVKGSHYECKSHFLSTFRLLRIISLHI